MLNSIALMGRLTRDPELRMTQNGTPVTTFTLAVERDGNREQTDFVDCVAWRKTAEFVSKWFAKGALMAVQGSLQSRKWTDKNDVKRTAWEVQVGSVWFCGKKDTFTESEGDDEEEIPL